MKTDKTICLNSKVGGVQPSLQDRIYDVEGCSTAITTSFLPNIAEPIICAMRGRNPDNPSERAKSNGRYRQQLEMNDKGTSNTITSVQKDNLVVEPRIIEVGKVKEGKHQQDLVQHEEGICRCICTGHHASTPHLLKTMVSEPQVLTPKRTEFGKSIRKQYDSLVVMEEYNKEGCIQVGNIYPDSENMANRSGGGEFTRTRAVPLPF